MCDALVLQVVRICVQSRAHAIVPGPRLVCVPAPPGLPAAHRRGLGQSGAQCGRCAWHGGISLPGAKPWSLGPITLRGFDPRSAWAPRRNHGLVDGAPQESFLWNNSACERAIDWITLNVIYVLIGGPDTQRSVPLFVGAPLPGSDRAKSQIRAKVQTAASRPSGFRISLAARVGIGNCVRRGRRLPHGWSQRDLLDVGRCPLVGMGAAFFETLAQIFDTPTAPSAAAPPTT